LACGLLRKISAYAFRFAFSRFLCYSDFLFL
jgi:hypothetical protein